LDSLTPAPWPASQAEWHAYAADLNARMALLQIHVEPRWLFALCTSCGADLEYDRSDQARFRFEVALHRCEPAFAFEPAAEPELSLDERLF
jgi:hypothetical protein